MKKKKTKKTPLMMAEIYDLTTCTSALAFESELSRRAKAQFGFVPKLSHHGGKNTALRAEKHVLLSSAKPSLRTMHSTRSLFFSEAQRNGVFASDDGFSCVATSGEVRACAGACSQAQSHDFSTKACKAKDISRGVIVVFVYNQNLN